MKLLKIDLNDRLIGDICFVFIFQYLVLYGIHFDKLPLFDSLNWHYFTILFLIFGVDTIKTAIESFFAGNFYRGTEDLSKVTVIIPTKNGGEVLEQTIVDLIRRFDTNNIIISSNGSTDDTCVRARRYGVRVLDVKEPLGKVGAINYALEYVYTPYCLILDDDTLIKDALIPTSALDEGYDGVAFRVLPTITNWITKIQHHEYAKSMDIGKSFHNKHSTVQNISGAIGLYSVEELKRQIELHTGEFSGEDLQRTLLIFLKKGHKGVVITDSIVETEVPDTLHALYKQRVCGWFPGLYSNLKNYLRILTKPNSKFFLKYDAFYSCFLVLGLDPLRLFSLPIMIFYPWYFILMYVSYVIIELIPYSRLKIKMPIWVVLVYPLYGLFGFVTRVIATIVFVYRRLLVYIEHAEKKDHYRFSKFQTRIIGYLTIIASVQIGIYIAIFYRYLFDWM